MYPIIFKHSYHTYNIVVRGDVKLFDFGLARFCVPHGDPNNDTFKMSIAGSPRYMSPECLRWGHVYIVLSGIIMRTL